MFSKREIIGIDSQRVIINYDDLFWLFRKKLEMDLHFPQYWNKAPKYLKNVPYKFVKHSYRGGFRKAQAHYFLLEKKLHTNKKYKNTT